MPQAFHFFRCVMLWSAMSVATLARAETESPTAATNTLQPVVYPFEALLAGKRGKVEADFVIDRQGRLVNVTIGKTDAPEFSETVRAHAEATDFSLHAAMAAKTKEGRNGELLLLHQKFEFDDRPGRKVFLSIATPSPAAQEILKKLRNDPTGKEYGGANNLDAPLQIISHTKPVFPRQLVETHPAGSAMVEFYVSTDGRVLLPRVISATAPAFGYSACQSVASWRFTAPLRNGNPVVVRVRVPVNYSLNPAPGK